MGNKREIKYDGIVIGYLVRYLPRQVIALTGDSQLTKCHKIGAFVHIQVDGKKFYTVRSAAVEGKMEEDEQPTKELHDQVHALLITRHPFGAERSFKEITNKKDSGKTTRRNELIEDVNSIRALKPDTDGNVSRTAPAAPSDTAIDNISGNC